MNLNFKFVEDEDYECIMKNWFQQKYISIKDIVDDYLMLCCFDKKEMTRDHLNHRAIEIGIIDFVNYKTKSILLREIHKRWLSFFYENRNQIEDNLKEYNPELLVTFNNRLQW